MLSGALFPSVMDTNQTEESPLIGLRANILTAATARVPPANIHHRLIGRNSGLDSRSIEDLPCFKDLIAVLIECFTIILLGYLSGRFKLISTEAKDLGAYLTTFALPLVIFLNIAQMEIATINLSFLFCMLISKLLLFIMVTVITLAICYPANFSYAGALSILSTQSNDFALGYPLFKSLYGESRPEMLSYLNLMGPIQLLIINPLGIVMLEYEKARKKRSAPTKRKGCPHCSRQAADRAAPPRPPPRQQKRSIKTKPIDGERHDNQNRFNGSLAPSEGFKERASISIPARTFDSIDRNYPSQRKAMSASLVNLVGSMSTAAAVDDHCEPNVADVNCLHSNEEEDRRDSGNEQLHGAHGKQTQPRRSTDGANNEIGRKNIKSLTLVMPAVTTMPVSLSRDSTDSTDATCELSMNSDNKPPSQQLISRGRTSWPVDSLSVASESFANSHEHQQDGGNSVYTRPKLFKLVSNSKLFAGQSAQQAAESGGIKLAAPTIDELPLVMGSNALSVEVRASGNHESCTCWANEATNASQRSCPVDLSLIKALLTNPLIIASIVALAVNLTNGPELPKFVTKVSNTIAASFAAPALFVVGLSMYGKFNLILKNPNDLLLASVLATTKVLVLPCILRTVVLLVLPHYVSELELPYLADFSYLYGLLPTAPGACIIAKQYEVLTDVVSICMLLSTLISAPLMLATAAVINQAASLKPETTMALVAQTLRASSGLTLMLSSLTLYLLWRTNRRASYSSFIMSSIGRILDNVNRAKAMHLFTLLLTATQLVVGVGGLMWLFVDTTKLTTSGRSVAAQSWPMVADEDELVVGAPSPHGVAHPNSRSFLGIRAGDSRGSGGFGALCTLQFILSSGGILLARFIVLCVVLTNFTGRTQSRCLKPLVSSLIVKVFPLVSTVIVLMLVFEAQHLSCSPAECSLPTWPMSIYARLTFNLTLLCLAVPLFVATFRLDNKAAWLGAAEELGDKGPRHQRRFATSSASLNSETSSALTTSTNLDSSFGVPTQCRHSSRTSTSARTQTSGQQSGVNQQQNLEAAYADSMSVLADSCKSVDHCGGEQAHDRVAGLEGDSPYSDPQTARLARKCHALTVSDPQTVEAPRDHLIYPADHNQNNQLACNNHFARNGVHATESKHEQLDQQCHHQSRLACSQPNNVVAGGANRDDVSEHSAIRHYPDGGQWSPAPVARSGFEFDKYSILVVFMLFQALLNVTTMIQQLGQSKPFGTFMLIELSNVALNFGQGLVTFLVIGLELVPLKGLFCVGARRQAAVDERDRAVV